MSEIRESLAKGEQLFLQFIEEIQKTKISDISIRRALKKYDVKNLKINNVTPLRAKKMYATIIPKYQNGITTQKSWLQNERRLFIWCTLCYLHKKSLEINDLVQHKTIKKIQDFQLLRKMFPLKELDLIKFQIYSLVKRDNKNCGWKPEEDNLLRKLVQKQDSKSLQWSNVSKQFFIDSSQLYFRNAKQCRERWLNHLDPNKMKGRWEPEQDVILLTEVLSKGKKWSKIVEALDGKKNEHMIKNRYKSLIHKKQKTCKNKKIKQNDLINLILKEYKQGQIANNQNKESEQDEKIEEVDQGQQIEQSLMQNQEQSKQEQVELKQNNFLKTSQNWPIIVQPNNKKLNQKQEIMQKIQEQEKESMFKNEIQLCGNKVDKQFVNGLFFNVTTPVAQQNRMPTILMETRSPAGNLFLSPFPAGCWTPTIFLVDEGQTSPQIPVANFSTTVKSTFHKFLGEDNDKRM